MAENRCDSVPQPGRPSPAWWRVVVFLRSLSVVESSCAVAKSSHLKPRRRDGNPSDEPGRSERTASKAELGATLSKRYWEDAGQSKWSETFSDEW